MTSGLLDVHLIFNAGARTTSRTCLAVVVTALHGEPYRAVPVLPVVPDDGADVVAARGS